MRKILLKRIHVMAIIKLSLTIALWSLLQWQFPSDFIPIKCFLIAYAAYVLIIKFWISPFRPLTNYLNSHPQVRLEEMEKDLQESHAFEHKLWIGHKWSFYLHKEQIHVIENAQIVWIYNAFEDKKYLATQSHDKPTLVLGNRERQRHYLTFLSPKTPNQIISVILERNDFVVVGFSTDKLAYFENNILDFLYGHKRMSS